MLNIGTLNVRGCNDDHKTNILIEDIKKYILDITCITETQISACEGLCQLSDYIIYMVNNENNTYQKYGVKLVLKKTLNPSY